MAVLMVKKSVMIWRCAKIDVCGMPENKVALGLVEGLNNKNRVIQRRSYGVHDGEYLRLNILSFTPLSI